MVANRAKDSLKGSLKELYARAVSLSAGGRDVPGREVSIGFIRICFPSMMSLFNIGKTNRTLP
jgi:hypothetical protein